MWLRQIFVAVLCIFLPWQQVAAVVNNGPSTKADESSKTTSESTDSGQPTSTKEADSDVAASEDEGNRREAPIQLGDTYGAPLPAPSDSYLPAGPSNLNLPVPVYGVPDGPTNNIVYPEAPPDIPPPISAPSLAYGQPISDIYGPPQPNNYLPPPKNSYGPPITIDFTGPNLAPPKAGPGRNKYGPQGSNMVPQENHYLIQSLEINLPTKQVSEDTKKPISTYGPPTGYIKDSLGSSKINFNYQGSSFAHSSHSNSGSLSQYGVPNLDQINVDHLGGSGISSQYGVPNLGHGSLSIQYGVPDGGNLGPPKPLYGPPQPSSHPKPPHPGVPAPPTPPDIKYDGWQPIPGLVSRVPDSTYGAPELNQHDVGQHSYNKDLNPPPIDVQHSNHGSVASLALENSYGPPKQGLSDSYQAPLNTVTGSGGIVSSSGDEAHGKHHSHNANVGFSQDVIPVKNLEYEVFPSGAGSIGGQSHSFGGAGSIGGHSHSFGGAGSTGAQTHSFGGSGSIGGQTHSFGGAGSIGLSHSFSGAGSIGGQTHGFGGSGSIGGQGHSSGGYSGSSNTYGAPPLNSYTPNGPYAASHSYNNAGPSFSTVNSHSNSVNSFNSHKSHGYKGSLSQSGFGLIPPSGVYGVPPSGHYGTPLYSGSSHGSSLNALKIKPPKHPIHHREPVPPGIFESITKHSSHKHGGYSGHRGSSATYLSPPIPDLTKPSKGYGPPSPSNLYSLPNANTAISFQNINYGSSSSNSLGFEGGSSSGLSSYNAPLNIVDGSYNLPQSSGLTQSGLDNIVGLDFSHPSLTIDLTQGHTHPSKSSFNDCSLKGQQLPSLTYGVPSANSYTDSLSTLTTNIAGAHIGSSILGPTYGAPEPLPLPASQTGYQISEQRPHNTYGPPNLSSPHNTYGPPDLSLSYSHKVNAEVNANSIIDSESQGKSYGKNVAASFGPSSELIQSQSVDLNNIPLHGALGSYTLQIQSADGLNAQPPHGQVLNDGLLQSILAAIEQPQQGGSTIGQPIIQLTQSLEQQNFITNDTLSSVVGQLADAEIRHSTQLAKDAIDQTSELSDSDVQASVPIHYIVRRPSNSGADSQEATKGEEHLIEDATLPLLEDNGIALYFSNTPRSKKDNPSEENNVDESKSTEKTVENSH